MNWTNIKLIASREIRDQLRDRRTIFVVAILPLMLYPLLGMSFLQVAQFMRESPTRVWIIGAEQLPPDPALLVENSFRDDLLTQPTDARLFDVVTDPLPISGAGEALSVENIEDLANSVVSAGKFDAVVYLSPEFVEEVTTFQEHANEVTLQGEIGDLETDMETTVPSNSELHNQQSQPQFGPEVFYSVAKDKSRVAHDRIVGILARWRTDLVAQTHAEVEKVAAIHRPFSMVNHDVSAKTNRNAAMWSKILPFIILIWALTGAFYPAIDLCAGEKERGTLETLLSCPASRNDIVAGKFLTVWVFSIATSLLNLASMGMTGNFVMTQMASLGGGAVGGMEQMNMNMPPLPTIVWLVVALIPISALFSALALALAAMARSTKEGQYYLMPLMMGTMPLMMLPMMPGVELDLGNSLIPVTGVVLLLRSLIEGNVMLALQHTLPVIGVTGICCWLAMLWAIHQFQDENVLFHESEQFNVKNWLVHVFRDRANTPTIAQAFLCAVLLLLVRFFGQFVLPTIFDWSTLLQQTAITQIGLIAGPAVVMALALTRQPKQTLLLQKPRDGYGSLLLAAMLALVMHPVVATFSNGIRTLYPISEETMLKLEAFQSMLSGAPSIWSLLLMVAVLPAICEELAFRGFILTGLRRMQNKWLAVMVSSLFFGIAHQLLQQSITAFAVGMLVGYIAIQTNSLFPCMLYHLIHNSLPLLVVEWVGERGVAGFVEVRGDSLHYGWPLVSLCIAAVILLVVRFQQSDSEEVLAKNGKLEPQPVGA